MDKYLSMEDHVNSICRGSYLQLKNIRKLREFLDQPSLECVVHAYITSKLDYCNYLLCGLPVTLINKLQKVQNTAARILTGTPMYAHITPVLKSLHLLPVEMRVHYKILLLMFRAYHGLAPVYIQDLTVPYVPSRNLRSSSLHLLTVPHTSSSLVHRRAFSVAGPRLWNTLPSGIRVIENIELFKSKVKTYLFEQTLIDQVVVLLDFCVMFPVVFIFVSFL